MKRILIAGIGNIFHGDDAFGCEVIRHIDNAALPEGVVAHDFGIRSYDLAYALGKYDAAILIDTVARGGDPGTVFLIEPDIQRLGEIGRQDVDAHAMNPVAVMQLAQILGDLGAMICLVGCEPACGAIVCFGMAGSAALTLMMLPMIHNPLHALFYLAIFGAGMIAGMTIITAIIAWPFTRSAGRSAHLHRNLGLTAGLASLGFGLFMVYQIAFVQGLLVK